MSLFNNWFSKKTTATGGDPVLDALVSISSDDPYAYVSPSNLRNSDVFTAINVIASDIASNPVLCDTDVINKMINSSPNETMDGFHFKYALAANMLLNGNSFAEILPNHNLRFIPNNQMVVSQDTITGKLKYTYSPNGSVKQVIPPSKVLHFKYFTLDGVAGLSPLYALKDELGIQNAGNELLLNFFNNGIHGTTVVKVNQADLNPDAIKNIRKKFDDANSGPNSMKTVVVDDSMDVSNLSLNTDVLKLVNSNDWTTRQIAKIFGLPVEKLGLENEHSNQEQSNLQYLQSTLQHYFDCFTSELSKKFGHDFSFNTDKLLSVDPATIQQQAVDGYTNGLLTRNEARSKLGLSPVDGGDSFVPIQKKGLIENDGRPSIND
ncbi:MULTISPECIES: phage portal protein [Limosilactobacillus]|uniref:phage portal protein n=1 Tax=Limosilactobacillus TaxID=2742598 RepID=UPI00242B9457|nr:MULTISPECIES: phage portal protein [Limosilactobacillus]MCI6852346.1 phage portal protein [Limosilactobacillus vaginalis]MDY4865001.1 phage portal protein [Limosilactobacillus sp.]